MGRTCHAGRNACGYAVSLRSHGANHTLLTEANEFDSVSALAWGEHWITNELHTTIHPYSDFVRPMREQIPGQRKPTPTSNQAETGSLPAKSNMANVDGSIQVCVLLETALLALELRL
jgi:hypothetical protein